ncbi:MAG TPA: hypothetical protein VD771_02870 [Gemmatimonadaceae bacterium]|nr:hypothetical protein [Gemmatimonadaceae bacterium]
MTALVIPRPRIAEQQPADDWFDVVVLDEFDGQLHLDDAVMGAPELVSMEATFTTLVRESPWAGGRTVDDDATTADLFAAWIADATHKAEADSARAVAPFEGFSERVHVAEPLIPLSLSYRGGSALRQKRSRQS